MKSTRLLFLWLSLLAAAFSLILLVAQARARGQEMATPPAMTLVVDNGAGMDAEVAALAAAWQQRFAQSSLSPRAQTALTDPYKLITFRNRVDVVSGTADSNQMAAWLSSLATGEDGTCPDDAFAGLAAAARLAPRSPFSQTGALLLTDSAPYGSRPALARIINLLAERDISVVPVIAGWCPGAPLAPQAMAYLAAGTGGRLPLFLTDTFTAGLDLALAELATPDLLALRTGGGAEFSDSYEIQVDSSVDTLLFAVDEEDPCSHPMAPLTCVRRLDPNRQATVASNLALQVRDPEGNLLKPGTTGVNFSEVSGLNMEVSLSSYQGARTGTFMVEISGVNAGYVMRVSAQSAASFNLLSSHTLPAGRPVPLVVGLLLPAVQARAAAPLPTEELFGAYNFQTGQRVPLDLRDDGQSRDGAAGDGIYGGVWQAPPGLWQLEVRGQLEDGTPFQLVEPAPIRVLRFNLDAPGERRVMPGDNTTIAFTLQNDSSESQQYELAVDSSEGWALTSTVPSSVTLAPAETRQIVVPLTVPAGAPAGAVEATRLTALAPGADPFSSSTVTAYSVAVNDWLLYLPLIRR